MRLLFLSAYNLFASHTCSLCFSHNYSHNYSANNRICFFHMQLHTRLTELTLTVARFVLLFYICTPTVCRTFSKRTLSRPLVYVYSHTCLSLMLVVVSLFECIRCICVVYIIYRLSLVALSFISFTLMILCSCSFCLLFLMLNVFIYLSNPSIKQSEETILNPRKL